MVGASKTGTGDAAAGARGHRGYTTRPEYESTPAPARGTRPGSRGPAAGAGGLAPAGGQDGLAARDHPLDVRDVLEVGLHHVGVHPHVPAETEPRWDADPLADDGDTRGEILGLHP